MKALTKCPHCGGYHEIFSNKDVAKKKNAAGFCDNAGHYYSPTQPILVNDYKWKGERWIVWDKCFNDYFNKSYSKQTEN